MSYFLFAAGLVLIFLGGYLLKKENKIEGENFQEILEEQNTNKSEYIKLSAGNQDLKNQLVSIEKKLDYIFDQIEIYGIENAEIAESSINTESSIDDSKASLNLRKGEVRYIQDILEK